MNTHHVLLVDTVCYSLSIIIEGSGEWRETNLQKKTPHGNMYFIYILLVFMYLFNNATSCGQNVAKYVLP